MTWLTDIPRLAREATPGPYSVAFDPPGDRFCLTAGDGTSIIDGCGCCGSPWCKPTDAAYLAALTPARILALVAVAEAALASHTRHLPGDCKYCDALDALERTP